MTLLQLQPEHKFSVVEMGANSPGEIAYLSNIAKPQVSLVTNVAPAHLEGFGSIKGVAAAKSEIYQGLPKDGIHGSPNVLRLPLELGRIAIYHGIHLVREHLLPNSIAVLAVDVGGNLLDSVLFVRVNQGLEQGTSNLSRGL